MTWKENHKLSSDSASSAELALREGNVTRAHELYEIAARHELDALDALDPGKTRTFGVTVVSTIALLYKARLFDEAEFLAHRQIVEGSSYLPPFAMDQIRDLLQTIWNEREFEKAKIEFTHGEVMVSVSGGEVVTGGAPLDLVLTKVGDISRYFYRTIEFLLGRPLRKRGNPESYIQEQCRPWLFQAPAGSYQFAVRVQRPEQQSFFEEDLPKVEEVTNKFLEIIAASSEGSMEQLERVVPNEEYRKAFLKMTRNLAPTGKSFEKMEIRPAGVSTRDPIVLIPTSREIISKSIKKSSKDPAEEREQTLQLKGTLRALDLDNDWLEIIDKNGGPHIRVYQTGEVIDDIVGPMVNRPVIIDAIQKRDRIFFRDIQIDE